MKIAIGADHGGVVLKNALADYLRQAGHDVQDHGTHNRSSVDYPGFAHAVARSVAEGATERGVLVCGSGIGVCIAANKIDGIRAGLASEPVSAALARQHNNAQVLCLGARMIGEGMAIACVDAFLGAEFEGGRHQRRVDAIEPSSC